MRQKTVFRLSLLLVFVAAAVLIGAGMLERLQTVCAEPETRTTDFPSTSQPDQVCLTWSDNPQTTQTIQWRTSQEIQDGKVQYRPASSASTEYTEKTAGMAALEDPGTSNDPVNHRFNTVIEGLSPGTAYAYRVGSDQGWSEWSEFTTAPQAAVPFSFVYMGDPQVGLDAWGRLLHAAYERNPGAAFYAVAGDNVNRGNNRDEWDNLFHAAAGVFDRRRYVPALGNHDYSRMDTPRLYLDLLTLPENGPKEIGLERTYCFNYSNALFVVLDSNASVDAQLPWLEEQLKSTKALWKFAIYHHPAYSSASNRDNIDVREKWGSLFDQYHLDMALQGHDHGYMRTKPMRGGAEVASPAEGTIYVVSVSGTKYYEVEQHDFAAKTLDHLSVYQVIDIQTGNENKLTYKVYDVDGNIQDELIIVK